MCSCNQLRKLQLATSGNNESRTLPYSIHESPHSRSIQVELGMVEGFWSTLQTTTTSTSHKFECWAASSLATDTVENQSAVPCDDIIRSDWVRPIGLCHLEFHARTLYFCHDNSRRDWHGNVHDNVNVFGLGGIDLLRCCCCGRASTETCYCQYIHNMLLWACKKYCCCKYYIHEITPHKAVDIEGTIQAKQEQNTPQKADLSPRHMYCCCSEEPCEPHITIYVCLGYHTDRLNASGLWLCVPGLPRRPA